jgi:hypothetical protein
MLLLFLVRKTIYDFFGIEATSPILKLFWNVPFVFPNIYLQEHVPLIVSFSILYFILNGFIMDGNSYFFMLFLELTICSLLAIL